MKRISYLFNKVAGKAERKEKWATNVQDATPPGVKLYIIGPIVIFKKLGGITSYCRPQQSKPGSKHIIAAVQLHSYL